MAIKLKPQGPSAWNEADRMLTLQVKRAAELVGCEESSPEEEELERLANAIEAYEGKRWRVADGPTLRAELRKRQMGC